MATPKGIRFAMAGIKGVGDGVVEAILQEREKGKFDSLHHFLKRMDSKRIGKKTIEALIEAGCFDFTSWSRDALVIALEPMYDQVVAEKKESSQGYMSLFSLLGESNDNQFNKAPEVKHPRSEYHLLLKEKELLGFFLTGHPMDSYRSILERLACASFTDALEMDHDAVFRSAFFIESVTVRVSSKNQKKFAILIVSDGYESVELPVWSDLYEQKSFLLKENQLLYAVLQVDKRDDLPKFSCRWLDDLTQANEAMIADCDRAFDKAKQMAFRGFSAKPKAAPKPQPVEKPGEPLSLKFDLDKTRLSHILALQELFQKHRGSTPVQIEFITQSNPHALLHIDAKWGIKASDNFHSELARACQGILLQN